MHLYSALLCIAVHPKHFTIMWGGGVSPQPRPVFSIHLDDATAATGQPMNESVFDWIEWASDSMVHSDGLTFLVSIEAAVLSESFDMNDSGSTLLKQGLAATYWRFYCHIY